MKFIRFFIQLGYYSLFGGLIACSSLIPTTVSRPSSPHEEYANSLRLAHLEHTALGIDWTTAGNRALSDSLLITVPYREIGYFSAQKPLAVGYRINAQRGDKLLIQVAVQGQAAANVFIDIFELGGTKPELVASAKDDTTTLVWEVRKTQMHLIRVQPELLRSGQYTISVTREPLLSFPVQGRTSRQIASYFGEARDGGKRRHEGIDVFAPRGTPLLASIDGVISTVGENRLGGHVVWLTDMKHAQRLYYAHLDRFNVKEGQRVTVGDTIGFVGNTGNAYKIAPHLHFGVYTLDEIALNPLPFVRLGRGPARQPLLSINQLNDTVRTLSVRSFVRAGPVDTAPIISILPKSAPLCISGGTANWLRVELPDGTSGYLTNAAVEAIKKPLSRQLLIRPGMLLDEALPTAAPIKELAAGSTVDLLGVAGRYQLIKDAQGIRGWLATY